MAVKNQLILLSDNSRGCRQRNSCQISKSLNEKLSRDGYMVVKILILVLKSYDFTIMLALNDYDYTYNPTFVESGGLPI
jgi:hypothetical protein